MVSVPGFLLRRLYVKGSLRVTEVGLAFDPEELIGVRLRKGHAPP